MHDDHYPDLLLQAIIAIKESSKIVLLDTTAPEK